MKFLMTYQSTPSAPPPTPEQMQRIGEYSARMIAAGKVSLTGGLVRPSHGIQLKREGGKFTAIDGPFAETKELIDGFAVVHVASKAEAIAVAEEFMSIAGDGTGEVLQIFDGGGPPSDG